MIACCQVLDIDRTTLSFVRRAKSSHRKIVRDIDTFVAFRQFVNFFFIPTEILAESQNKGASIQM